MGTSVAQGRVRRSHGEQWCGREGRGQGGRVEAVPPLAALGSLQR